MASNLDFQVYWKIQKILETYSFNATNEITELFKESYNEEDLWIFKKLITECLNAGSDHSNKMLESLSHWIDPVLRSKIKSFAHPHQSYVFKWEKLESIKWFPYSQRINENGVVIHKIKDKEFAPMLVPYPWPGYLRYCDLNNDASDLKKWKNLDNLKSNEQYQKILQAIGIEHQSLESHNTIFFWVMQQLADRLWLDVLIDWSFLDNKENNSIMFEIWMFMRTLFGIVYVPYRIDSNSDSFSLFLVDDSYCWVIRRAGRLSQDTYPFIPITYIPAVSNKIEK